jgi:hypothetical protein
MIKPESNAPVSMQPWVRTTDNQIEQLETAIAKINSVVNTGSPSIDHEQNQSISNTFSFTPLDDGSTVTSAQAMNFTGPITAESNFSVAGSLVVGDPSRQEYNPVTEEAIGSIPNLKILSGQLEINPVTETEYYTTGQFNITDTTMNVDAYGLIHGDGLQITLANDGDTERQNVQILGASGDGTTHTFEIASNAINIGVYTAGKYVNITGVLVDGYNGNNLLITSVNDTGVVIQFTVYGEETATYTGGGYVTINQPNSIYEGKLTVQGPSPDYTGVTVDQNGVHVGVDGGDPTSSNVRLDSTGLVAPNAFVDQAVINGTRLFISDTTPTAVNDGDLWIDKSGVFSPVPFVMAANRTTSVTGTTALTINTGESFAITFPVGRFSTSPAVTASTSSVRYVAAVTQVTSSGFTLSVRNVSDATGTTYLYHWQAIEILAGMGN